MGNDGIALDKVPAANLKERPPAYKIGRMAHVAGHGILIRLGPTEKSPDGDLYVFEPIFDPRISGQGSGQVKVTIDKLARPADEAILEKVIITLRTALESIPTLSLQRAEEILNSKDIVKITELFRLLYQNRVQPNQYPLPTRVQRMYLRAEDIVAAEFAALAVLRLKARRTPADTASFIERARKLVRKALTGAGVTIGNFIHPEPEITPKSNETKLRRPELAGGQITLWMGEAYLYEGMSPNWRRKPNPPKAVLRPLFAKTAGAKAAELIEVPAHELQKPAKRADILKTIEALQARDAALPAFPELIKNLIRDIALEILSCKRQKERLALADFVYASAYDRVELIVRRARIKPAELFRIKFRTVAASAADRKRPAVSCSEDILNAAIKKLHEPKIPLSPDAGNALPQNLIEAAVIVRSLYPSSQENYLEAHKRVVDAIAAKIFSQSKGLERRDAYVRERISIAIDMILDRQARSATTFAVFQNLTDTALAKAVAAAGEADAPALKRARAYLADKALAETRPLQTQTAQSPTSSIRAAASSFQASANDGGSFARMENGVKRGAQREMAASDNYSQPDAAVSATGAGSPIETRGVRSWGGGTKPNRGNGHTDIKVIKKPHRHRHIGSKVLEVATPEQTGVAPPRLHGTLHLRFPNG